MGDLRDASHGRRYSAANGERIAGVWRQEDAERSHRVRIAKREGSERSAGSIGDRREAPSDYARFEALLALVDNIKDPRVVPVLGPSLSSGDRQIRSIALSGLHTIANAEACSTTRLTNENDEAAFERETASCKAWWEREGKYRSWTRNLQTGVNAILSSVRKVRTGNCLTRATCNSLLFETSSFES